MPEIPKRDINMSDEGYLGALVRLQGLITQGLPLHYEDSNAPGDKYNWCTWGLCSEVKEMWPDPEMHLWPNQFIERGRIAPLYRQRHHLCPLDMRNEGTGNGCFYTCLVFQSRKYGKERGRILNLSSTAFREEVMSRLEQRIETARSLLTTKEADHVR